VGCGRKLTVRKVAGLKTESFGQISRQVFFSPKTTGNKYLKMAFLSVPPGSSGAPHIHLGEEIVYTIQGRAVLSVDGVEYVLEAGSCVLIPPDLPHPARVEGQVPWVAVAAYCDECPVLKKERGQQQVDYPIAIVD
jgi:quercetin dioxygenase-like cupin family protein